MGLRTSFLMLILPCIRLIFSLSILWIMKFFVKDFCETVQVRVFMFGMQVDDDVLYCILETSLLMLILLCICPTFFLSKLWIIKFFDDKDFCKIMQAGVVIFGKQVDNDVLYLGIANQPCAYSSLYLFNFLSFHTLIDECFCQRFP